MIEEDRARLEAIRARLLDAQSAGHPLDPFVTGPEHALLAKTIATDLRALQQSATGLAELVSSWQYLAVMCGLFDDLDDPERPDTDWRTQIEQALAFIDEATA